MPDRTPWETTVPKALTFSDWGSAWPWWAEAGRVLGRVLQSMSPPQDAHVPCLQGLAASPEKAQEAACVLLPVGLPAPAVASAAPGRQNPRSGCGPLPLEAELAEMQRALSPCCSPHDSVVLLREKHTVLKVRDPGGDTPPPRRPSLQWRARRLLQLAEELQAEWQEAQRLQDLESLCSTHALGGATAGWALESKAEPLPQPQPQPGKPAPRGAGRAPRTKEKHKVVLREHKSHKEELPRLPTRHLKPRSKAAGPDKQGATRPRALGPTGKSKRKRAPLSKTSSGRQPADPRGGRYGNPVWVTAEELKCLQEKPRAREGRRRAGKAATVRFARGRRKESQGPRCEARLEEVQHLWPVSPIPEREAETPTSSDKRFTKKRWQRELEFAFEQLFNTNRKLKRHLDQHLDSRSRKDQRPQKQAFLATQGCRSDTPQERAAKVETRPAGKAGVPAEAEVPQMSSETDSKQSLSKAELPKCHQVAQPEVKDRSQTPVPGANTAVCKENFLLKSTDCEHEASELAALMESCPPPQLQEQALRADWLALGQRPRLDLEWRRPKPSFESVELPDMSLEIHYSAEMEEERKERRRVRLALLRSYPSKYQLKDRASPFRLTSPSNSSIVDDEDKQNQMIRDIQLQISEQNKLHEQFLEKARKRLLEFQSIC